MINRVLAGRYRITEKIATGGMAEVYKAQDMTLGRTVAVKVMLPQYAEDPTFAARFRQEAQAAANLSSPYIVNIYDWGQDEGTYYIIMEYVRGIDLKTAINQRGRINERKVAEIGSEVCSALSVAHGYDIIHRDIKPQNIMIQPDGNAKVMDFGIARAGNSSLTQTDSVLGTAHYVSPEQAQGKPLTAASDLYSLGIVLYEAVTGRLPFDGPDAVSVAMQQVNNEPLPPSAVYPEIDPVLEAIIMHAMEKNPEDRFASANDMRTALNNWIAGRPVTLGVAGFGNEETTVMNRSQQAQPAPTETMVMPKSNESQAVGTRPVYEQSNDERPAKKSRKKVAGIIIAIAAVVAVLLIALFLHNCSGTNNGTVPDVEGMTKSKAETTITNAGYTVGTETEQSSSTVPAGNVISQDPAPRTQADPGTKVNLVISTGTEKPKTVTVPDLTNMTPAQAQQALINAGLTPKEGEAQFSDTIESGKVMSQDVAPNSTVNEGSTVTYVVSKGKETVSVPSVIGMSQSRAESTLTSAGFVVSVETQDSSESEGTVLSQSPSSGTTADKGSTVTIVVSTGSTGRGPIPDVTGMSENAAISELESSGFNVGSVTTQSSESVAAGEVISYSPHGNAEYGTYVDLVISSGSSGGSSSGGTSDS